MNHDISYLDGGGGTVPGPTEWDIRIFAKVPEESLDEWTAGLASTAAPEASWVSSIPNAPATWTPSNDVSMAAESSASAAGIGSFSTGTTRIERAVNEGRSAGSATLADGRLAKIRGGATE